MMNTDLLSIIQQISREGSNTGNLELELDNGLTLLVHISFYPMGEKVEHEAD